MGERYTDTRMQHKHTYKYLEFMATQHKHNSLPRFSCRNAHPKQLNVQEVFQEEMSSLRRQRKLPKEKHVGTPD